MGGETASAEGDGESEGWTVAEGEGVDVAGAVGALVATGEGVEGEVGVGVVGAEHAPMTSTSTICRAACIVVRWDAPSTCIAVQDTSREHVTLQSKNFAGRTLGWRQMRG